MHTENSILIHAPVEKIFEAASDLSLWPRILPHYRWIKFLEKSPAKNIIRMAANRSVSALFGIAIPVQWTSELEIDRERMEIRFHHLTAFTKGMLVVWTFTPTSNGIEVRIRHDLKPSIPIIGTFIAETIIGRFFVGYIANQTLYHMKQYVEKNYGT